MGNITAVQNNRSIVAQTLTDTGQIALVLSYACGVERIRPQADTARLPVADDTHIMELALVGAQKTVQTLQTAFLCTDFQYGHALGNTVFDIGCICHVLVDHYQDMLFLFRSQGLIRDHGELII